MKQTPPPSKASRKKAKELKREPVRQAAARNLTYTRTGVLPVLVAK